jgi:8-oxo-dGTP pyrophosphatase MutT (NUDIX family)
MQLRDRIRHWLSNLQLRPLTTEYKREAAVLMPIFERDGEPYFLLTRRSEELRIHKGQISFPGGSRDDGESLQETALRETFEELGLHPGKIEILGRFHEYLSSTEYRVVPYAGYLEEPFITTPEPCEVAEVLQVPFSVFMEPKNFRVEQVVRLGRATEVYFYSYGSCTVWGLTARIIKDFLDELKL